MSSKTSAIKVEKAARLMNAFSERTGINGKNDPSRRYLWTDAFAVQNFLALFHFTEEGIYRDRAFKLIHLVHQYLGKYHPQDERNGWISEFEEEKAKYHPTAGGLRIGKKLPERKENEDFDERLEWERDGQYFHYLTRWLNALLQAGNEEPHKDFSRWALELLEASSKFITPKGSGMYWKMSTDLSRPLVKSMGAHDPLEGLVCTLAILERFPDHLPEFDYMLTEFEKMCEGQNWKTYDSLGIGGLLLNALRLKFFKEHLPVNISAEKLMQESLESLNYYQRKSVDTKAHQRLAFRECGMSLGIQVMKGIYEKYNFPDISHAQMKNYTMLAEEIEDFWLDPKNHESFTWKDHLDINQVSHAASLLGNLEPEVFLALPKKA
ncbi:hypothetical protein C7S20_12085 [Christiangramia fulva]|uniref:Uncharacterized protein n=1 Tax=Christiangramia fulva TaxID=2126553 RepID=A0A2R3Z6V0_9FLAO|nr:hypothetical protein [Christiangramia fulva]AVR45932.1 hypothetical protein C7S20_12085 [Christiangramia fulva]